MTIKDFMDNVEVQGEYEVVYFDEKKCERVKVKHISKVHDCYIKYVYCENNTLFIEIELDN